MKDYPAMRDLLLADPSSSYWLKDAILKLDRRDPLDAYDDACVLRSLQAHRISELPK